MQTENLLQTDGARDVLPTQPADLPSEIVAPPDNETQNSLEGPEGWLAHALG